MRCLACWAWLLGLSMPIIGYLLAACGGSGEQQHRDERRHHGNGRHHGDIEQLRARRQAPPQPAPASPQRLIRGPAWSVTRRGMSISVRATSIRRNGQLPSVRILLTQPDCWADQHGDPGVHCGSRGIGRTSPTVRGRRFWQPRSRRSIVGGVSQDLLTVASGSCAKALSGTTVVRSRQTM